MKHLKHYTRSAEVLMKKPLGSDAVKMCNACGVSMTTTREYKDHMRCHHSEESLKCNQCEQMFYGEWKLNVHIKTHREYSYQMCERTFKYEQILVKHMKIAHEDIKLYCHYFNNEKTCPFKRLYFLT